jgi:hypothetical protein
MTPDFEYTQSKDGFISLMPNTADAIDTYNNIFANGAHRLMPHEFAAFKSQARKAGYTVRKSKPASVASLREMDAMMESTAV